MDRNSNTQVFIPADSAATSVGADSVAHALAQQARNRNLNVSIIRTGSRGMLWLEPLVEVNTNTGRVGYGPIQNSDIPDLLDASFLSGENTHPKALGPVEKLDWMANQERLTFARCGIIDPLDFNAYQDHGGLAGAHAALNMTPADVVATIRESGLRGRGGAGFPAGIKWETARTQNANQKYLCCNADEGDSGTFADRMLMEGDPLCLIEGMVIAAYAIGATTGYIYIRSEYPRAIDVMKQAISLCRQHHWLGHNINGKNFSFNLNIRVGAGAYICGEESSMLNSLEGQRGMVRAKPPIPAINGLFGKPTIVNNVLTLAAVPWILQHGAKNYADFGAGRSTGTQPFQLAGDVARGGLVEKSFGITLRELVEDFGGGTRSGTPIRAVQIGGPLGAYLTTDELDTPLTYEDTERIGAMLGHGGVVVFNTNVDMAQQARYAMEFCEIESCGKCTPCRIGAVRGKEALERVIAGENTQDNLALVKDLCEIMTEASLCAMGGLTPNPVMSAINKFPEDFPGGTQ